MSAKLSHIIPWFEEWENNIRRAESLLNFFVFFFSTICFF